LSWKDRFAVAWTRASGAPEKLADMVLTETELRVTFSDPARRSGIPGLSMLHDMSGDSILVYPRNGSRVLPPQLRALLPPDAALNPQRRMLLDLMLASGRSITGLPTELQQWEMLVFAGRNAVGHIDVFENDRDAQDYYTRNYGSVQPEGRSGLKDLKLWGAFRKYVSQSLPTVEEDQLKATLGPTPGVAGFVPKMLCTIELESDGSWKGKTSGKPAGEEGGQDTVSALVKIEQNSYPGLLQLESLAYEYHRKAGIFDVPRTWLLETTVNNEPLIALASERFDRNQGVPLPLESMYSILHTGSPTKYLCNTDGSIEKIGEVLNKLRFPYGEVERFYAQFVMSLLTGNGDLHTDNIAILTDPNKHGMNRYRLSPLFDPAPMRAYRGRHSHNVLSALPFGGGEPTDTTGSATPGDLFDRMMSVAKAMGIKHTRAKGLAKQLHQVTEPYLQEAIELLRSIPKDRRPNNLAPDIDGFEATIQEVRSAIARGWSGHASKSPPTPSLMFSNKQN